MNSTLYMLAGAFMTPYYALVISCYYVLILVSYEDTYKEMVHHHIVALKDEWVTLIKGESINAALK